METTNNDNIWNSIHVMPLDDRVEDTRVPYIVYEGEQARNERHIKRLIIALVITILLLFGSNAIWLYAWMQYDYESMETTTAQTVDVNAEDGVANYIGNDGDIVNGSDSGYKGNNSKAQSAEEGK